MTISSRLAALLGSALLFLALEAVGQRSIDFAEFEVPPSGAIAVPVRPGDDPGATFRAVDAATAGALARARATVAFAGERGTSLNLLEVGPFSQVLLVGLGNATTDRTLLEDFGGLAAQAGTLSAAPVLQLLWAEDGDAGAEIAFGATLGQYVFSTYRAAPLPGLPTLGKGELLIRSVEGEAAQARFAKHWQPVTEAVLFARDLVSEPPNAVYPESFVERSRAAFSGVPGVSLQVLDVERMQALSMNALIGVGQGSQRPPRLLIVRYNGAGANDAPLVFAGKGITFDTGGISLKEGEGMWKMKYDMAGAAAVTATVLGLAKRGARVNAIAVAALAENMPSGSAQRPGDVQRTGSGKSVEIISTDAEGRLVLADAVWYVQREFKPAILIDVATLTGSVVTALGDEFGGLFSRDEALATQLLASAEQAGEPLWRLPLHDAYIADLKSPIADMRNSSGHRKAGAGVGAQFIGNFIEPQTRWAHMDIAGMAWREDLATATVPLGASGYGVRLLDQFVRDQFESKP